MQASRAVRGLPQNTTSAKPGPHGLGFVFGREPGMKLPVHRARKLRSPDIGKFAVSACPELITLCIS